MTTLNQYNINMYSDVDVPQWSITEVPNYKDVVVGRKTLERLRRERLVME